MPANFGPRFVGTTLMIFCVQHSGDSDLDDELLNNQDGGGWLKVSLQGLARSNLSRTWSV